MTNKFKARVDEELEDLVVTEKLKKRTFNKIFKSQRKPFFVNKYYWFKGFSLASSFILVLILGINVFFKGDTKLEKDQYIPNNIEGTFQNSGPYNNGYNQNDSIIGSTKQTTENSKPEENPQENTNN